MSGRHDRLLLNNQWRVVVEHQPPVPLLLYPYSRKAVVTRNSFASVLPIHCGAASLDSCVSVDAHLHLVGGDGLKLQFTGRKIGNHLRLGSHGAAWAYADKISSIDALKGRRISIDLRLDAFLIQLPYDPLDACSSIPARARSLSQGDRGRRKDEDGYDNCSSHGEFTFADYSLVLIVTPRTTEVLISRHTGQLASIGIGRLAPLRTRISGIGGTFLMLVSPALHHPLHAVQSTTSTPNPRNDIE